MEALNSRRREEKIQSSYETRKSAFHWMGRWLFCNAAGSLRVSVWYKRYSHTSCQVGEGVSINPSIDINTVLPVLPFYKLQ